MAHFNPVELPGLPGLVLQLIDPALSSILLCYYKAVTPRGTLLNTNTKPCFSYQPIKHVFAYYTNVQSDCNALNLLRRHQLITKHS